jgi:hypothetical protein
MTKPVGVALRGGLVLKKETRYFAIVRVTNLAHLQSHVLTSDGVLVGKVAVRPAPGKTASVGFSTMNAEEAGMSPEERAKASGSTMGSMAVPYDSLGTNGTRADSLIAGVLDEEELAAAGIANPGANESSIPARNFAFGNYTFTVRARDADGKAIEGFVFSKPIVVSMFYDAGAIADRLTDGGAGGDAAAALMPQLNFYSTKEGKWMNARDSCPVELRMEVVDVIAKTYSVHVCHLTQFGVFYQQPPVALLRPPPGAVLLANASSQLALEAESAGAYFAAASAELPPLLWSLGLSFFAYQSNTEGGDVLLEAAG